MYSPEEIRAAGLDDFRVFLYQVWDFLGHPDPTPLQLDLAYYLQHGPKRLVLQAFRGAGKSWITTTFALWNLFINPDFKVEVVSATGTLSDDISKFALQLIREMPLLQWLYPSQDQRKSRLSFDVRPARPAKDPSMKSAGITGQITGTRADLIIADDVEIPKNSYTHHLREKLSDSVREFDAILKPEDHSRIIYLGTPQVEESLYSRLRTRGYTTRIWPVEVPENPEVYKGALAPFVQAMIDAGDPPGTPVEPTRFPRRVLDERLASYGRSGYALQFLLDTSPASADKFPLKLTDLIIDDVDNEIAPAKYVWGRSKELVIQDLPAAGFSGDVYHYPAFKSDEMTGFTGTIMAIDPSGRGKDELAYSIIKNMHSQLFLVANGGFRDGYSEKTLKTLAALAGRHKVDHVIAETNFGGGMFNELLKPYLTKVHAVIDEEWNGWSTGMKEQRILQTLEPVIQQHKLIVDRRVIEKDNRQAEEALEYSLAYQLTRLENVRGALPHDDRVESLAMACKYFMERMDADQDQAVEAVKQEEVDAMIQEYLDDMDILGGGNSRYFNMP